MRPYARLGGLMVNVAGVLDEFRDEVGVADVALDELVVDAGRLGDVAVDLEGVFLNA